MSELAVRELIEFQKPVKVDRLESGAIVLRRVKYLGPRSKNINGDGTQNVYPLESRRASEDLYEGAKLYSDHPPRHQPGQERSVTEQLGRLRGPFEHSEEGSFADAHLNPKHPLAEQIAWSAAHSPDDLGLSHNAQGVAKVEGEDCRLEKITRVRSVDFVCAAATTQGLFESQQEEPVTITKEKLAECRETAAKEAGLTADQLGLLEMLDEQKLLSILSDETAFSGDKVMRALALLASSAMAEKPAEASEASEGAAEDTSQQQAPAADGDTLKLVESLRKEVDDLKVREQVRLQRDRRDSMLAESQIPTQHRTEVFVEQVRTAGTDEAAQALIEDRKRLVFHQEPTSGGRPVGASTAPEFKSVDDLDAFLNGRS